MNFLAHLYLAGEAPERRLGNILGEFVRGRDLSDWSPDIAAGIRQHRAIDSFTDHHPRIIAARARLNPEFRRYGGILLDMVFDHYLARDWRHFHDEPLERFAARVYAELAAYRGPQPGRMAGAIRYLREHDLLVRYRELATIVDALAGIGRRFAHATPLHQTGPELERLYRELESDFQAFFPELIREQAVFTENHSDKF